MPNFTPNTFVLKRFWKITRTILLVLIGLILLLWLALQTSPVQNWLVRQVTGRLSKDLQASISIRHVDISFFNKIELQGVLVKDRQKDTLLSAGSITVNINDWFFLKDRIELKYAGLKDMYVHLKRSDSVWNYKFLADYFSGGNSSKGGKKIEFLLRKVELDHIRFFQQDGWRGEDQHMELAHLEINAEVFDLAHKTIRLDRLQFQQPYFSITNYEGNRPDSLRPKDIHVKIKNDTAHLRWNPDHWAISIKEVDIENGRFQTLLRGEPPTDHFFDGSNIDFSAIDGVFKNVRLSNDSIIAEAAVKTKERSGLQVDQLKAHMVFHPEAMEFSQLDLRTPKSRLHDYFAMRYASFDDLSSFISHVTMVGSFNDAVIHSDDIAYFAPALENWNRAISVSGKVTGTLENLRGKNMVVEAGNNTYLKGDLRMSGLPDIDKTYIDFDANDFSTTYADASTLIPALKTVTNPRLDQLQYLHFRGNFAGFINDFVTYGTLETQLGTVISDLNMKFSKRGQVSYSGNISTDNFDLGPFIDVKEIGRITFRGKVNGNGLSGNDIAARLDGTVDKFDFNGYTYHNLLVKGTAAKKKFNGQFYAKDPNLDAYLNGLVDFSTKIPRFDLEARIDKADLKKTHFTKENIEFAGTFRFDFEGNDIDNFLGTARISDASLLHDGVRIPFDSLYLESKVLEKNKVITLMSNEFDAALVGEFSIAQLPDAFNSFLNKYFPSYVRPSRNKLQNENFSFVVTTKNIQDYLPLFNEDIKGFNYSTITGRINNKESLLDINAEIPQFNFRNTAFYNLALKGSGNLSRLSLQTDIADVYINDSLHFPGTSISIASANDSSDVKINTSANQTLNSASLAALVVTRPNGVSIRFKESSFDVNGKSWTIQENGELILSRDLVNADGVKIYNGQQEIRITSVPSDISNTNDIKIELQKINIGDFAPYVVTSNRLEGLLTGTVDIIDPFGKMQVDMGGEAEQFRLDDDSIGRIQLTANYNKRTNKVNFSGISDNLNYRFDIKGLYAISDSTKDDQLDLVTNLNDTKIDLLERYLNSVFSSVTGKATGQLRIVGPPNDLRYLGDVTLKEGRVKVGFTNVDYLIPKADFKFLDDRIDFGSFTIKDTLGNTGLLTRGILRHQGFDKMDFDFELNTNKLLALNTTNATTDPFYGTVVAKANLKLTGPVEDMLMTVRGQAADSSEFNIRAGDSRESGQADFIVWKTYGKEMVDVEADRGSKLTMLMDINATNLVKMNVIIDEMTNDVMKAQGHGNLKIKASTAGELEMTGQVDIDRGSYDFDFQSLLRKPFLLTPESGSYIRWNGDPYKAEMKVTAEYKATNVKFSDLGDQLSLQTGGDADYINKFRGEVKVIAHLTGALMKPQIEFELEMPESSPLRNDPLVTNLLRRIRLDPNELNKQVAFLIIFNSFGPLSSSAQTGLGGRAWEGIVSSSISGFISNQLNKEFSKIVRKLFNDESIKVNFNAQLYNGAYLLNSGASTTSSFNIDRTSLNVSLAKSMFKERLTFTFGSAFDFGLTAQQARATNSMQFLPDITAAWKLRQDGKLLLTFFYRDSYNYQSATGKQNRSGVGISYRRDFERFSDLFRNANKKKKKEPDVPQGESTSAVEVKKEE